MLNHAQTGARLSRRETGGDEMTTILLEVFWEFGAFIAVLVIAGVVAMFFSAILDD